MKTLTSKNEYGTYCIPDSSKHRISSKKILKGLVWEPETIQFIIKYCEHELIHAGAYFGDMLPAFSKIIKVWAFEPCKENYECALKTIEMNGLTNITLINKALGETSKTAKLMVERNGKVLGGGSEICNPDLSTLNRKAFLKKQYKSTKVQMTTIDETIPKDSKISVIHLDVEGYEPNTLHGAVNTIKRCSPFLLLETHKLTPKLKTILTELNYIQYTKEEIHCANTIWRRE